jgi:hypothetical protein
MEESVPGVAGRDIGGDTEGEKRWREKKVGSSGRGQSIIKLALSRPASVNEGYRLVKKGRTLLKNGLRE